MLPWAEWRDFPNAFGIQDFTGVLIDAGQRLGGELLERMGKSDADLTTVAKLSKEMGVSAGMIRKALKDANVKPEMVKAGCSYYSKGRVDSIVRKLKKA